jgi:biotin synthase
MMDIDHELERLLDGNAVSAEEAAAVADGVTVGSRGMYEIMHAADALTRRTFDGRGEVHAQIGVNLGPCPKNCGFCVFGEKHGLVSKTTELPIEEVVTRARTAEREGANAIYLMTTAGYDFDRFLRTGRKVRGSIDPKMPLVANVGDFSREEANDLVSAGFTAVYHVVRLREGIDTGIDQEERLRSIEAAKSAGLDVSYCVEPIGPEHSAQEIVGSMFRAKDLGVAVQATMRRVAIPGAPLFFKGQITEVEQAKVTALARLVMGESIYAMGVHEPSMPSLMSGANMVYAETGSNPRDITEDTREGRGRSVGACKRMLQENGFRTFDGPARSLQGWLRE